MAIDLYAQSKLVLRDSDGNLTYTYEGTNEVEISLQRYSGDFNKKDEEVTITLDRDDLLELNEKLAAIVKMQNGQ